MQAVKQTSSSSTDDQPLRMLLVRSRPGELPWLATTIAKTMAPVEIIEVIGFANAIWRLGNERFDSVLLDVEIRDPAAMTYCREQIADVAAVPVLNLRDQVEGEQTAPERAAPAKPHVREPVEQPEKGGRRGLRVPWQRRPRRQPQQAAERAALPAG